MPGLPYSPRSNFFGSYWTKKTTIEECFPDLFVQFCLYQLSIEKGLRSRFRFVRLVIFCTFSCATLSTMVLLVNSLSSLTILRYSLCQVVMWSTNSLEIWSFVHFRIHCLSTSKNAKIPTPIASSVHFQRPIIISGLIISKSSQDRPEKNMFSCFRTINGTTSSFLMFLGNVADIAAQTMLDLCTTFSVPKMLVSNRYTNYDNITTRLVGENLNVHYHLRSQIFHKALVQLTLSYSEHKCYVSIYEYTLNCNFDQKNWLTW